MACVANGENYDLLKLHAFEEAENITEFCDFMRQLDVQKLIDGYAKLKACAPRRHRRGKEYFRATHNGMPTNSEKKFPPREEHLAMALFNDFAQKGGIAHAEISELQFLDYQFPLYAREGSGVKSADLFGVIDNAHPCVIELKKPGNVEAPLRALLEALAYCAIVEANIEDIANEAQNERGVRIAAEQPRLMILAPDAYWKKFIEHQSAGNWQPAFRNLLDGIHTHIGLRTHLVALPDDVFPLNWENSKPRLHGKCILKSVQLED